VLTHVRTVLPVRKHTPPCWSVFEGNRLQAHATSQLRLSDLTSGGAVGPELIAAEVGPTQLRPRCDPERVAITAATHPVEGVHIGTVVPDRRMFLSTRPPPTKRCLP
jgi:hypothetical protein